MRTLLWGAVSCALAAQAPPLSFPDLQARALRGAGQLRTEALLAERRRSLAETRGFLREGPTLGLAAGPRTQPLAATATDQSVELDLPLFLDPGVRGRLEAALGKADPVLRQSAQVEAAFQLRLAFLDAWLAQELLRLREADLSTAQAWLQAARARREAGADPAFQATLVEGEVLRAQLDLAEARRQRSAAWGTLRTLADLPVEPGPLADPGEPAPPQADGLPLRYARGVLRRALALRLDLDAEALRHQEALAGSRWNLRGSYGREFGDRITKIGLAYRFNRPGESRALRRETAANLAVARQDLERAQADLDARFQSALERLGAFPAPAGAPGADQALKAVSLRLEEGRERPSDALPIRRQLLETQQTLLRRRQTFHALLAELQALTEPEARP